MSDALTITVSENAAGDRCDRFIIHTWPQFSRAQVQRWLETGAVTLNGQQTKASHKVHAGDVVCVVPPAPVASALVPEDIPIEVLFEDSDLIVINKSANMVVHPGAGQQSGTLVHALLAHCEDLQGVGDEERPGIVHRLDKGTSGVMVVAKSDAAHRALQEQFQERSVEKEYVALVQGVPPARAGVWDKPIGRHPTHRKKMSVIAKGRSALTRWECVETFDRFASILHLHLHTGRTHQIRVHAADAGYPLIGDATYGGGRARIGPPEWREIAAAFARPALHAYRLKLTHPRSGKSLEWTAPIPDDLQQLMSDARRCAEAAHD